MATGYEVQMYRDISRIAKALERIAGALEHIDATYAPPEDKAYTEPREQGYPAGTNPPSEITTEQVRR